MTLHIIETKRLQIDCYHHSCLPGQLQKYGGHTHTTYGLSKTRVNIFPTASGNLSRSHVLGCLVWPVVSKVDADLLHALIREHMQKHYVLRVTLLSGRSCLLVYKLASVSCKTIMEDARQGSGERRQLAKSRLGNLLNL
eukprot:5381746-Amphidinium_carterae.1